MTRSIRIKTGTDRVVPTPFVAVHVSVTPFVSVVKFVVVQPLLLAIPDSGSLTIQLTVTLLMNHSLLPSVPVIIGATTGGVLSTTGGVGYAIAVAHTTSNERLLPA